MAETFEFEIVTPARSIYAEQVELVIIPGAGGNFGVLPGHAPLLSTIQPGVIEIREKSLGIVDQYFVDGGFAEVTPGRTAVLAEEAIRVADISRDDAEARLRRAHDALMASKSLGLRSLAEHDVKTAEAMVAACDAYAGGGGRGHG
jgi:F-type H+-transporting ATPase subunit epsilon